MIDFHAAESRHYTTGVKAMTEQQSNEIQQANAAQAAIDTASAVPAAPAEAEQAPEHDVFGVLSEKLDALEKRIDALYERLSRLFHPSQWGK